jgi:hypothetical protein
MIAAYIIFLKENNVYAYTIYIWKKFKIYT